MNEGDEPVGEDAAQLGALLEYLYRNRGFDFSGYKTTSLVRRIHKRMQALNIHTFSAYTDQLEVDPNEFNALFNTILINVTSFFRDGPVWESLAAHLDARVLGGEGPVRVWSPGCASGQETYSLAMQIAERIGLEAFERRVKIYATDMDEEALNEARQGSYTAKEVTGVAPELLERYFDRDGQRHAIKKELRKNIIFGRHNLLQDSPISRIDLLSCRNTLMYFNAETQAKILSRFHFALRNDGVLFLGKAEILLTHGGLFVPLDLKRRIFAKVARSRSLPAPVEAPTEERSGGVVPLSIRESLFERTPHAQLVLDTSGHLLMVNDRARTLFGLTSRDVGRPFRDVALALRPELRTGIDRSLIDGRPIVSVDLDWPVGHGFVPLEASIIPLQSNSGALLGVQLLFFDAGPKRQLQQELLKAKRELEATYEELQSTSEELETTNEELQSTVEELETTNEELQSTNEELETMNEELQSTNEELQTTNDELRLRSDELNQVNGFLHSILSSLRVGVVVLDHDLHVRIWNHRAEDLWGMRQDEVVGKHFLNLDIGLPTERLRLPIRACVAGDVDQHEMVLEAVSRRGKAIACR
ncbi:MAG: PAS domain S-box protein [Proteobacteria bacterium]|nr:MAG: PAS domain S-box protein [Pseudomonadota bacterium]